MMADRHDLSDDSVIKNSRENHSIYLQVIEETVDLIGESSAARLYCIGQKPKNYRTNATIRLVS